MRRDMHYPQAVISRSGEGDLRTSSLPSSLPPRDSRHEQTYDEQVEQDESCDA